MDSIAKSRKLIETASAVLAATPNLSLKTVVLNKVLFYLDLASLRDHGQTMTMNSYVALKMGPVVAKYQVRLIDTLVNEGIAIQESLWDGSKPIRMIRAIDSGTMFDQPNRDLIRNVTSFFADTTSVQASRFSHQNPGWRIAWRESRRTGKIHPIDLRVAMQQIIEDDPWMETPLVFDDESITQADQAIGVTW